MKLLIIGDLHGNKPKIHYKDFDAIIAPGDFCSDALRRYYFEAIREKMKNPESDLKWYEISGRKKAEQMLDKSWKDGRKILEFLNSLGKSVYLVPGNWDQYGERDSKFKREKENRYSHLIKGLDNLRDVHFRKRTLDGIDFIGYGVVSGPEIPQYKEDKDRLKKDELKEMREDYEAKKKRLSKIFQQARNPTIFMPHNVPFKTKLDMITNRDSPKYGYHYGSVIAREIIEKYQPLLCIGGHMHEHFGKCRIGKTVCINAGFGSKVNTLIDLDEEKSPKGSMSSSKEAKGKIRSIKFHPRIYG